MLESDRLRVGVWNLEKRALGTARGQAQAEQLLRQDADVWLLTEVPADFHLDGYSLHAGASRPGEPGQVWSAIASRWPLAPVEAVHPTLALAVLPHPTGKALAAGTVLPWRAAAVSWPKGDGQTYVERFRRTLDAHLREIHAAGGSYPLMWGGDFNQALSDREYVGTTDGREALIAAFAELGLRAATAEADGALEGMTAIDHLGVPEAWAADVQLVHPCSGDVH